MTYGELRQAVVHLGLVDSFDDPTLEAAFSSAASRAQAEIVRLRGSVRTLRIAHRPLLPSEIFSDFSHFGEDISKNADKAAAFCFYISHGSGVLTLKNGKNTATLPIHGAKRTLIAHSLREIFPEPDGTSLEFIFGGEYYYSIDSFAVYDVLCADGNIQPPDRGVEYDMSLICEDFLRFCDLPLSPDSDDVEYLIEGSKLIIPLDACGDYTVSYIHRPREITEGTREEDMIDLDADLLTLMPHLTAYYIWLDDMPAKAAEYYRRYTEAASLIVNTRHATSRRVYHSSNGWD